MAPSAVTAATVSGALEASARTQSAHPNALALCRAVCPSLFASVGSMLGCSRSAFTTSTRPCAAAVCRGVSPYMSAALTSAGGERTARADTQM